MDNRWTGMILRMPLFAGFTEHGVQALIDQGEIKQYGDRDVICREGDAATGVLLLLAGALRAFIERNGKELPVMDVAPGTIAGEVAVLCGIPRTMSMRASEPSTVLHWSADAFRQLVFEDVFLSHRIFGSTMRLLIEREKSMVEAAAGRQA